MLLTGDDKEKLNTGDIVVGFDLSDAFSQISYSYVDGDDVETLSTIAGGNSFCIPTALFKRREVNQWFAGREAVKNAEDDGFFIDNLLKRAREGEEIVIGEDNFRPSALIALFMKRTLALVNMITSLNHIVSFMVTVDQLDNRTVSVLQEATASLGLKTKNIFFQSHMESFYYYTIYQPRELWNQQVLLFDMSNQLLRSYRMECNKRTTPIVAFIEPDEYPQIKEADLNEDTLTEEKKDEEDALFLSVIEDITQNRTFSSIYLIGDSFKIDWAKESIKSLCRKGRVFRGNNLFSKGACYSAKDKVKQNILSETHVFLGNDKLKSNVGMNVLRRGENSYLALLDAGVNWFEAYKQSEFILSQGNKVSLVITPLTGKNPEVVDITLEDLPKRPVKATRLRMKLKMLSESRMLVQIEDLGFGEMFPACETVWSEEVNV